LRVSQIHGIATVECCCILAWLQETKREIRFYGHKAFCREIDESEKKMLEKFP